MRRGLQGCLRTLRWGPLTEFGVCKENCQAALEQEKVSCRASHGRGTEELDQCIDEAAAFLPSRVGTSAGGCGAGTKPVPRGFRACNNACSAP